MPQRVEPLDEATLKAKIEHDPAVEERLELKLWPWKRIKDDKLPVKAPILEYGNLKPGDVLVWYTNKFPYCQPVQPEDKCRRYRLVRWCTNCKELRGQMPRTLWCDHFARDVDTTDVAAQSAYGEQHNGKLMCSNTVRLEKAGDEFTLQYKANPIRLLCRSTDNCKLGQCSFEPGPSDTSTAEASTSAIPIPGRRGKNVMFDDNVEVRFKTPESSNTSVGTGTAGEEQHEGVMVREIAGLQPTPPKTTVQLCFSTGMKDMEELPVLSTMSSSESLGKTWRTNEERIAKKMEALELEQQKQGKGKAPERGGEGGGERGEQAGEQSGQSNKPSVLVKRDTKGKRPAR